VYGISSQSKHILSNLNGSNTFTVRAVLLVSNVRFTPENGRS